MRGAFARTLTQLAEQDERIMLLTGDLGFMALEPFSDRFPGRFLNAGVAEQNMVGVATGLAESGFLPFVYSIVTFATLRPFEFIRNGPVLHDLPVRIVGIGGGFEYGHAGPTHFGLEDVGVMRTLPGMTVIAPADHLQAATAIQATWDHPGPVYYRLGKDDRTEVPGLEGRFELGRAQIASEGSDVCLVVMGSIAHEASVAVERLGEQGISAGLVIVASLSPPPVDDLVDVLGRFDHVVTIEAHTASGGVGSLVAEVIAEAGLGCRLERCAVRSRFDGIAGGQRFHWERHGLTADQVAQGVAQSVATLVS